MQCTQIDTAPHTNTSKITSANTNQGTCNTVVCISITTGTNTNQGTHTFQDTHTNTVSTSSTSTGTIICNFPCSCYQLLQADGYTGYIVLFKVSDDRCNMFIHRFGLYKFIFRF